MDWLLGTSLGATVAAALYPFFRYVLPPEVTEALTNRVLAGKLSQPLPKSGKLFRCVMSETLKLLSAKVLGIGGEILGLAAFALGALFWFLGPLWARKWLESR